MIGQSGDQPAIGEAEYTTPTTMTGPKRPSTSSLRRFINSRPYLAVSEIRRRFGLDEDAVTRVSRNGTTAFVGLPEREALKLAELWQRGEVGLEFSVEVRAPAVVGVYPMRVARYVQHGNGNGAHPRAPASPGAGAPGAPPQAGGPLRRPGEVAAGRATPRVQPPRDARQPEAADRSPR